MVNSVNMHDAKTQLSKLVERAEAGHETVIARAGKPVAKLVPLSRESRPRKLGALKGKLKIPVDFDAPLAPEVIAAFEGS
ncbi:MAG: type II toxin-antitoxin system Phd/YefM family antitoxin [Casimicrobiaceae bacterium]